VLVCMFTGYLFVCVFAQHAGGPLFGFVENSFENSFRSKLCLELNQFHVSLCMSLVSLAVLRLVSLCFHCLVLYVHACCVIVTW